MIENNYTAFDHKMVLSHLASMHHAARFTPNGREVQKHLDHATDLVNQSHLAHLSGDREGGASNMRLALYPLNLAAKAFNGKLFKKVTFNSEHSIIKNMASNYDKPHVTEKFWLNARLSPDEIEVYKKTRGLNPDQQRAVDRIQGKEPTDESEMSESQTDTTTSGRTKQQMDKAREAIDSVADNTNLLLPGNYHNPGGRSAPNGEQSKLTLKRPCYLIKLTNEQNC